MDGDFSAIGVNNPFIYVHPTAELVSNEFCRAMVQNIAAE